MVVLHTATSWPMAHTDPFPLVTKASFQVIASPFLPSVAVQPPSLAHQFLYLAVAQDLQNQRKLVHRIPKAVQQFKPTEQTMLL